ncbi:hypothetical protein EVAR_7218_1 [Eumeta japonica]|uniref:Uncharacterized protein n=1 Tax=Eumeta variegata TaxID=151549 RepID=A0A4C1T567_EUMVA|nr:hypothetical protein EVAR_7218_1 [Eumeta japonica]
MRRLKKYFNKESAIPLKPSSAPRGGNTRRDKSDPGARPHATARQWNKIIDVTSVSLQLRLHRYRMNLFISHIGPFLALTLLLINLHPCSDLISNQFPTPVSVRTSVSLSGDNLSTPSGPTIINYRFTKKNAEIYSRMQRRDQNQIMSLNSE